MNALLTSVDVRAQVPQNVAGFQKAFLRRFVIAGFDRRLAFLIELARVEELFALGGIGGTAVAHVRQLE